LPSRRVPEITVVLIPPRDVDEELGCQVAGEVQVARRIVARVAPRILRLESRIHLRTDRRWPRRGIPQRVDDRDAAILIRCRLALADLVLIVAKLEAPCRMQGIA